MTAGSKRSVAGDGCLSFAAAVDFHERISGPNVVNRYPSFGQNGTDRIAESAENKSLPNKRGNFSHNRRNS